MSDKEDRKSARKTLKTAKKGSAAYIEAMGILSGDDPEKREYRKTIRKNNNKTKSTEGTGIPKSMPKKKKMRQPTKKELKKGKIAGTAFGGQRALTPGDKEGEMIYSRPDYKTGKTRVQVTSGVEGGRGTKNPPRVKPTPSKGQIHSAANKEKIDKAAKAADKRAAKANRSTIRKNEAIGQQQKRKKENEDIDKGYKTVALKGGGEVYNKKHGGKTITSKMSGQDLVNACYD